MKMIFLRVTCLIFLLNASLLMVSNAQESTGEIKITGTAQHSFVSKINNRPYQLSIALPFGYSATDTTRYPVLYVLDADPNLPLTALIQRNMSYDGEVPNMILVGIGYPVADFMASVPYRTMDLTPTEDAQADSEMTAHHHRKMVSGGGAVFLRVLEEEIMPFVEQAYKTNHDRALAGHSFGGLFAAYTLFSKPALFDRYLISSPSLDWDHGVIFKEEKAYYSAAHHTLHARVFISAGSLEPDEMIPDVQVLAETLQERNYAGLTLTRRVFEDETHLSVISLALSKGMRAIYQAPHP